MVINCILICDAGYQGTVPVNVFRCFPVYLIPVEIIVRIQTPTEISNDYASFLEYALYLGVSFATTNPPLVDMAWAANSDRWNAVADSLVENNPGGEGDALARLGTLEVGKEATLIVTDGDPLEIRTHVQHAFLAGRQLNLDDRHKRLYDKYRARPRSEVPVGAAITERE